MRRIVLQRTAAQMPHSTLGNDAHTPSRQLHPPAEVDLLHVSEEIGVESARTAEDLRTAAEGRTAHPENVTAIVVLSSVFLQCLENTPPAERESEPVDESARSARIFETIALGAGQQFRPHGRHVGRSVQRSDKRFEPPLRRLDIGVEQHPVIALQLRQSTVIAAGKAVILRQTKQPNRRKLPFENRNRFIRRAVVRHDDLHLGRCRTHHRGQETPQMSGSIPIEYDDLYDWHCGRRCFQRRCDQSHIPGSATISRSSCRT